MFNFLRKKKVEETEQEPIEQQLKNPSELLMVKLFFESQPVFDDEQIEKELKKRFDKIGFPENTNKTPDSRHYFFKDYEVKFVEGVIPAQATIFMPEENKIDYSELEPSFKQSWNWPEAEETVKKCSYEILLTDLMSREMEYKERIAYFQKYVSSIVAAMKPAAVWIKNSEVILHPTDFLEGSSLNKYQNISVFMNIRLFNIQETEGEMIMDTIGLHSLGLPDFEFRFTNYDPQQIASVLYNYGHYIFENGIVIKHGNTIEGIEKNQKWKCYFNESQLEPKRIVIEIDDND
ncbi:DUF4261 domain-containing protein [Aquimarina aquimarini]|uniref:DUF4261 domain-containing protein n=1 Tax=Aquimarina aquimarini TaxID=1191734 RepID=UPI000D54BD83|nr:DUF4261 domain-containing protein [Aquimarina aquimarini]